MNISKVYDTFSNPKVRCVLALGATVALLPWLKKVSKLVLRGQKIKKYTKKSKEILQKRQADLQTFINKHSDSISPELIKLVRNLTAVSLAQKIRDKVITSYDVCRVFAYLVATEGVKHRWVAYLTSEHLETVLSKAKQVDKVIAETKDSSSLPPFFGVPISVKDATGVEGFISSTGMFKNYYKSLKRGGEKESIFIRRVKQIGFIPLCQSQGVQAFYTQDSGCYLWGDCFSSYNNKKSCGGSSSGEGGLLGAKLSAIGIGADIGGSLRVPSIMNGTYSLKCNAARVSTKGRYSCMGLSQQSWQSLINSVNGPMTRSVEDLVAFFRCTFGSFEEDFNVSSKVFDESLFQSSKKLKIAVLPPYNNLKYAKANEKAFKRVTQFLKENHEVVSFPVELLNEVMTATISVYIDHDLISEMFSALGDEPYKEFFSSAYYRELMPNWILKLVPWFLKLIGEKRQAKMSVTLPFRSKKELFERTIHFKEVKAKFFEYCKANNIDALINPSAYIPCFTRGKIQAISPYLLICCLANGMDIPSGVLPVKLVEEGENIYEDEIQDSLTKSAVEETEDSVGMPVGVMINGFPGKEEVVLRLMKEVDDKFKFGKNHNYE